jgi:hypothetical protein
VADGQSGASLTTPKEIKKKSNDYRRMSLIGFIAQFMQHFSVNVNTIVDEITRGRQCKYRRNKLFVDIP